MSLLRGLVKTGRTLEDAALLVRRAGLEHLVDDVTEDELVALANAGERIASERAFVHAMAIRSPAEAAATFDGGEMKLRGLLHAAVTAAAAKDSAP